MKDHKSMRSRLLAEGPSSEVLESDAEPDSENFVQFGAWENAYFATRSKLQQKRVNCIILANLWDL